MGRVSSKRVETRRKVVHVAAAEMRARGPNAVGVADVMQRSGLTHGGFYAHFSSKDALVAAALEQMFAHGEATIRRIAMGRAPEIALGSYIDLYLSARHRDRPEIGCPIAALSPELARQGPEIRRVFEGGLSLLLGLIEPLLPAAIVAGRRAVAMSMVAEMAGAIALSRAVFDPATSTAILVAAAACGPGTGGFASAPDRGPDCRGPDRQGVIPMNALSPSLSLDGLSGLEILQAVLAGQIVYEGINRTLDFEAVSVEPGRVAFAGTPNASVYNPLGRVHGGYAATLLDSAMGCAVHSMLKPGQSYTTLELKVAYHKPITAETGRVEAVGTTLTVGRRAAFTEATLRDADGRLLASATSTLLIIDS